MMDPHCCVVFFCLFKQKTAYEMRISDWSSDVCSSDLSAIERAQQTLAAYQQVHLAAQCPQHAGQLDRDVAGTDHRHLAWCRAQVEKPVRIDAVFVASDIGPARMATDRKSVV